MICCQIKTKKKKIIFSKNIPKPKWDRDIFFSVWKMKTGYKISIILRLLLVLLCGYCRLTLLLFRIMFWFSFHLFFFCSFILLWLAESVFYFGFFLLLCGSFEWHVDRLDFVIVSGGLTHTCICKSRFVIEKCSMFLFLFYFLFLWYY